MKLCPKCQRTLPLSEFWRDKARRDGLQCYCKDCLRGKRKETYHRNPEVYRAHAARYKAANPDIVKNHQRLYYERHKERLKAKTRAYYQENKDKRRAYERQYEIDNREKVRERQRLWRENNAEVSREIKRRWAHAHPENGRAKQHRRRARLADVLAIPFTGEQLEQRLSMFSGCWMCADEATQVDHVKPIAKGGAHVLANLRPICSPCNARKQDTWPLAL